MPRGQGNSSPLFTRTPKKETAAAPIIDEAPARSSRVRGFLKRLKGEEDTQYVGDYSPYPIQIKCQEGIEAPHGLTFSCRHPNCLREYGMFGYWGEANGVLEHNKTHQDKAPIRLIRWPENYAGKKPDLAIIYNRADRKKLVWIKVGMKIHEIDTQFEGWAKLENDPALESEGQVLINPVQGDAFKAGVLAINVLRDPLPGERVY